MSAADAPPVAELLDLSIAYRSERTLIPAVRGASLAISRGECVAIVGESGSGKSTIAAALTGLLAVNAVISGGTIRVDGQDMTRASEGRWRGLSSRVVGLVPQDPMVSLNPTMRIGRQIAEAAERTRGLRGAAVAATVLDLLEQVGLDRPAARARQYPHELSGGMRQLVLIAIALAGRPKLLVADEPTSALDATVQKRVLDHLEALARDSDTALLIITHDLGVAADRADRILVMQGGRIVEHGRPRAILRASTHPYTQALVAAAPALAGRGVFSAGGTAGAANPATREILRFENVEKNFALPGAGGLFGWGLAPRLRALDDVSFSAHAGRTLAIVGESGSGKTTALRIAMGLDKPDSGRVSFEGLDLTKLSWNAFRPLRRRIRLVQQNPFSALDPRYTVFESVTEPLRSYHVARGAALVARARELMDQVRLSRAVLNQLPRELSGGQRQRVAIARALALGPDLLFLDEPVSALDVSVQARILDLLIELQREIGVSYVLVSHDLSVVASIAHEIVVMHRGRAIERGGITDVITQPRTDHARALLDAVPGRRHLWANFSAPDEGDSAIASLAQGEGFPFG